MTVPKGTAVASVAFFALTLAGCAANPTSDQASIPESPEQSFIEGAAAVGIAFAESTIQKPTERTVRPAWLRRIEANGTRDTDGDANLSLASVQPLYQGPHKTDTVFTQMRIEGSPIFDDPRGSSNIGLGYRRLLSKDLLVGVNGFYDRDWDDSLERTGLDAQIRWRAFDMTVNYYNGIYDADADAQALDGYSVELRSQVPYLPWARTQFSSSDFFNNDESVTRRYSAGLSVDLVKYVELKMVVRGNEDETETGIVKLNFNLSPNLWTTQRRVAFGRDSVSDDFLESRNMQNRTLDRVPRINAIVSDS